MGRDGRTSSAVGGTPFSAYTFPIHTSKASNSTSVSTSLRASARGGQALERALEWALEWARGGASRGTALRGVRRMLFHVRSLSAPRQPPRESAESARDRLVRPTNWAVTEVAPGQRPQQGAWAAQLARAAAARSGDPRRQRQQGRGLHSPTCSRSADTSCSALSSCTQNVSPSMAERTRRRATRSAPATARGQSGPCRRWRC